MSAIVNNVTDAFPDPEQLLALPTEEIAAGLLHIHAPRAQRNPSYTFQVRSDVNSLYAGDRLIQGPKRSQLERVLLEGFTWLQGNALIADEPEGNRGWKFVTRRGISAARDFPGFLHAKGLDRGFLEPVLAAGVWSQFTAGQFQQAVFAAFKEVEIAVRAKGNFPMQDHGTVLMRQAFNKNNGPLRDEARPEAEQDAIASLFAGAIGYSKNPHSHRHVGVSAQDAVEMIYLANHLLRLLKASPGA